MQFRFKRYYLLACDVAGNYMSNALEKSIKLRHLLGGVNDQGMISDKFELTCVY